MRTHPPSLHFDAPALTLVLRLCVCLILLTAALPAGATDVYNFIGQIPYADWNSTGGTTTYNDLTHWSTNGFVYADLVALEDDATSTAACILMYPPLTGTGPLYVEGTFGSISIPANAGLVRFQAEVGYWAGAGASSGVEFSVYVYHDDQYYELAQLEAVREGRVNTLSADLTAFKGQDIYMTLRVEAGANATEDWASWRNVKIVTDGTTVYDFVADADDAAFWANGDNTPTVTFGTWDPDGRGMSVWTDDFGGAYAEDLVSANYLCTYPNTSGTYHSMRGRFNDIDIPDDVGQVKFVARVGFAYGMSSSDGVTFKFYVDDGSGMDLLGSVDAEYDGVMDYLVVDLTDYKGETVDCLLKADSAGGTTTGDWPFWSEAQIVSFEPELVYDFVVDGDLAIWNSGASEDLEWSPGTASDQGYVNYYEGASALTLEDGNDYDCLKTHPNYNTGATERYIEGIYNNVIIPNNWTDVQFTATVGMQDNSTGSDGVVFSVYVERRGKKDLLCSAEESDDGNLSTLSANLSGYQGENISIILEVDAKNNPSYDWACWVNPRITAKLPTQVFATDYGVVADDSNDDMDAMQAAVAAAQAASPSELLLPSGTIELSTVLEITDANNFNLKGDALSPTQMVMGDATAGCLSYNASTNVATRNLVIDYEPLPFTQGVISNLSGNTFDLTIDTGYSDWNDSYFSDSEGKYQCSYHESSSPYRQPDNIVDAPTMTATPEEDTNHWHIQMSSTQGVSNNMKFVYQRRDEDFGSALVAKNSLVDGLFIFDNVTVYASPCTTFMGMRIEKLFVRNCNVMFKPNEDRYRTGNADGVFVGQCVHGPDVLDSLFEGLGDDGVGTHTFGSEILEKDANQTRLSIYPNYDPLEVGDHLTLFRPSTGALGNTVEVTAIHSTNKAVTIGTNTYYCYDITVDQVPISGLTVGLDEDRFFSEEYGCSDLLVDNCTFRDYRGKGVVGQSANTRIANNTFDYLSGAAVWLANYVWFDEGLLSTDVTVKDNAINYCGRYNKFINDPRTAIITVALYQWNSYPAASIGHDDITITGNDVTSWPRYAIYVGAAQNVTIDDNQLDNPIQYPDYPYASITKAGSGKRGVMMFDNVDTISVTENDVDDDRPSWMVNGNLFLFEDYSGEVYTNNNAYDTTGSTGWSGDEIVEITSY